MAANAAADNFTWCSMAYEIDGVLANQASYYMDQYSIIEEKVQQKALSIVNTIGLSANSTTSTPLVSEFSRTKLMQSFL